MTFEEHTFDGYEDAALARWDAGCNEIDARVEVGPHQVVAIRHAVRGPQVEGREPPLGPAAESTDRSCPDEEHEQDAWLADFFLSDPRWAFDDEALVLDSHGTTMVLEEQ